MGKKSRVKSKDVVPPGPVDRKKWAVAAVLLAGLCVRLVYFHEVKSLPFFHAPVVDSAMYHEWAKEIAEGRGMARGTFRGVFIMSPGYPLFLAAVYLLGGDQIAHAVIVQALIGVLSLFLIYRIARRLFDERVAMIALVFATGYGLFVFYEFLILIESLYMFMNLWLCDTLLVWSENPSRRNLAGAGLQFGAAMLLRPSGMLLLPLVLPWIYASAGDGAAVSARAGRRLLAILLFLAACAAPIAPVTYYNWARGRDFNLITCAGGPSFVVGNSPWSDGALNLEAMREMGLGVAEPNAMFQKAADIVERERGSSVTPSELSRYAFRKGFGFILSSPGGYGRLLLRKMALLCNRFEIGSNYDYYYFRDHALTLKMCGIGFGIVAPLALLGAILALPAWRKTYLLYALVLQIVLFSLIFYVLARYRLPMVPFMIIFAAYGCVRIAGYAREKKLPRLAASMLAVLAAAAVCYRDPGLKGALNPYYNLGVACVAEGKYAAAIDAYRKCLSQNPDYFLARYNLGNIYYGRGEWDKAIEEFRAALAVKDDFTDARQNLANSYAKKRDFTKAIAEYGELMKRNPNDPDIYYNLSLIYRQTGDNRAAEEAFRKHWDLLYGRK